MRGKEVVVEEINEDIDLSLSLSLNERFGVDPQRNHKLTGAPSHLINPHQRRSAVFNENGSVEVKMRPSFPTGPRVMETRRQEVQSLAPMDANRRSLHSSGSSTISYFQNQIIEGHGFPANIGSADKNRANGREFKKVSEMPHVYTTISGRKINGYLSKYNQEETRILCACHAISMTPAEFIKHAGGGDVAFPERHITVMPVVGDGEVVNPHY
ncbi:ninja-family protein AFP3-like [Apium graveolens]|uniref:ninja-family protein AFP3-like n=1 Tax=Apium graveolens TaxID=4045 RepID=UPI003D78DDB7